MIWQAHTANEEGKYWHVLVDKITPACLCISAHTCVDKGVYLG